MLDLFQTIVRDHLLESVTVAGMIAELAGSRYLLHRRGLSPDLLQRMGTMFDSLTLPAKTGNSAS